jgi:signal transduction histidine kinase
MDIVHGLADEYFGLLTLLDRGEALRATLDLIAQDGDIAWIGEPAAEGGLVLRTVRGDLTGQLRGLLVPPGLGLTGKVHRLGAPAWVNDYFGAADITHTFDRQIRDEGVTRLLAVPVVRDQQLYGVLAVGARHAGEFAGRAVEHASKVASQAGLAIAVAERARLAREAAVHEERSRVAAELHDTVGALLFAVGSGMAGLAESSKGDPHITAELHRLRGQVAEATTALRNSLRALRASPSALALSVALQADCTAFSDRAGIPAELVILDDPPELAPSRTQALIGAVREALLNVEKHARASAVVVTVSKRAGGGIIVAVTDDGAGLGPDHARGVGLANAADAIARLGGTLHVTSDPSGGTAFRIELSG